MRVEVKVPREGRSKANQRGGRKQGTGEGERGMGRRQGRVNKRRRGEDGVGGRRRQG